MLNNISRIEIKGFDYPVDYEKTVGGVIAKVFYNNHWIQAVGDDKQDAYSKLSQHIYTETKFSI